MADGVSLETTLNSNNPTNATSSGYAHLYDIADRQKSSRLKVTKDRAPVSLSWSDVTYSVKAGKPKQDKMILDGISGSAKAGQLVAIMGPSGSGKTTLLNILSGRCMKTKGARLTGQILVNQTDVHQFGAQRFSEISAFVQQDDALFSMQTVRETLLNAARLRLPKAMSIESKQERVDRLACLK